ncbi:hypothetical protein AB0L75_25370 [Streptomyces sp. NPDC052101]|uniref:hypothetical protein n=1 Tax=Streptomyces sp. NPDC052101 TaxID=3155763 RepID=UPI00343DB898
MRSRYERRLAELPVGGRQVAVRLTVRRFFCGAVDWARQTFVEQVEGPTTRYARAAPAVKVWWRAVAPSSRTSTRASPRPEAGSAAAACSSNSRPAATAAATR